jgi:hypothetical protein
MVETKITGQAKVEDPASAGLNTPEKPFLT